MKFNLMPNEFFENELSYFWIRGIYLSNFQRDFTPIGVKQTFLSHLWEGTVAEWSKGATLERENKR